MMNILLANTMARDVYSQADCTSCNYKELAAIMAASSSPDLCEEAHPLIEGA